MQLVLEGRTLPIAQQGVDFPVFDQPVDHPPGPADILLKVDRYETRWTVRLPDGLSASQKQVRLARP